MQEDDEIPPLEENLPTTPHPYAVRNRPQTMFQAFIARRSRLIIHGVFQIGFDKCVKDNREVYNKEKQLPITEKTFKDWGEVDVHCMLTVNKMIRKHFIKQEYEMYDCFEECERKFPKDEFPVFDMNFFRRIPCNRKCEDEFNDKIRPFCLKMNPILGKTDFTFQKIKKEMF